jgi:DNA polymerase-3 subunit beta
MEIRIPRAELYWGVSRVYAVADARAAQPILANVLLEAAGGELLLTATDYEIAVRASCQAEVLEEGSLTINARRFWDIIRELPEEEVRLAAHKEHWAALECGRSSFRLAGLPAEEFPPLPSYQEKEALELPAQTIREMVAKTLYAVSTDETRYVLNGVLFKLEADTIEMVATDGHRLAQIVRKASEPVQEPCQAVIPRKALHELSRLLEPETDSLRIVLQENHVVFLLPRVVLVGRLIEGQFPNYEQVIPERCETVLTVDRQQLLRSLKRVSLMASDKSKMVKLSLSPGGLKLASEETELGAAQEEMEADYQGQELEVGFNARYLLDALGAMEAEEVALSITEPLAPGLFEPLEAEHYKCVIMPMRI